jgi:UDP-N-acetylmuramoylalanine--D-glutamate ligase
MRKQNLHGLRVTVMGLGHFGGGASAARWLACQGAAVTVTDLADRSTLSDALRMLAGEPIAQWHLDGHREEDFRDADWVVVNPAVRPGDRFVALAVQSDARLTSEIELFLGACPARIIGVTGSNGKSTTAAMTARVLEADGRRTWLGGNIGRSLLDDVDRMNAGDWVVVELSSFQLWHLSDGCCVPEVAVVTNCTPNHLNWHPTFSHYAASKQRILLGQHPGAVAVLNTADSEVAAWSRLVRGHTLLPTPTAELPPLAVPGEHNRINAACAAAAAAAIGCRPAAIRDGLRSFRCLPQRLELVASVAGRRFYNDSASTTPESTIAALRALQRPIWLLAGGTAKGADDRLMIRAIIDRVSGVAFFGSIAESLQRQVTAQSPRLTCVATETMADALAWCWKHAQPGHEILLSPGCASQDQFRNYRHRGETFVALVGRFAAVDARAS